mgnify:CR=1 FL=1
MNRRDFLKWSAVVPVLPVGLIGTDVVMPKMSGRELSEQATSIRGGLKTLFMSGYTDDSVVRHRVIEKDRAFLQKPLNLSWPLASPRYEHRPS